jgi:hypothetical protein
MMVKRGGLNLTLNGLMMLLLLALLAVIIFIALNRLLPNVLQSDFT